MKIRQIIGWFIMVIILLLPIFLSHAQTAEKKTLSILAVGDIMLSRNVASKIVAHKKDVNFPFLNMADTLAQVDYTVANLESPFSGKDTFPKTGSLVFNAPTYNVKGLINNKIQVLSLANNHAFDQGLKGLEYTSAFLAKNGLFSIGAGKNTQSAWKPLIKANNELKIAYIAASYSSLNDNGKVKKPNLARIEDLANLRHSIEIIKNQVDYVIVVMHAGTEYTRTPNKSQVKFAHAAIDYGADMVIGHHPHWIQTIEKYQDKYIFYSLGNFVFDQMWSQETKEGLALQISLSKQDNITKLEQVELKPVIIEDYAQPRLANEIEKALILKKINAQPILY